jgi:beta-fructofuranosidase
MRPFFHFTARRGWINDPHGITVHNGKYHAFFQYVPESMEWAPNCHWGHATGPDLLTLTESAPVLLPGDGDDGIWSGSLTRTKEGHGAVIHFTAVTVPDFGVGKIRVAYPTGENWERWEKDNVVVTAPDELDLIAFRDPFVFRDAASECWHMFVGAGTADGVARALSYHSEDLHTWTFDGEALSRSSTLHEPVWTGALWECPQLIQFGDRAVMVSSVWDNDVLYYVAFAVGTYVGGRFNTGSWGQLSYGPSYYAPSFFRDAEDRPCLTFWMRGVTDVQQGWAGAHSVPYLLELIGDQLVASPHNDLLKYRRAPVLPGASTPALAADVIWKPKQRGTLSVSSRDEQVCTIEVDGAELTAMAGGEAIAMPYSGGAIRIILDGPTLEISTVEGLLGASIDPQGDTLTVQTDGEVQIWALGM